eukprot:gb/GECG01006993.1/.p1 GENE.gb/GECG01006993.1/~~gb/GECG01006993.1/.p1  ORF type:complete len:371 (+),score=11.57 gb/GECG01006993.1/:1-1113(+)
MANGKTASRSPLERLKDNYCWRGSVHLAGAFAIAAAFVYFGTQFIAEFDWQALRNSLEQCLDKHAPWMYDASAWIQYPLAALLGKTEGLQNKSMQLDAIFFTSLTGATQTATFWIVNGMFTLCYIFQPSWVEYYKMSVKPWPWNGSTKERAEYFELVRKSIGLLLLNHFLLVPVLTIGMYPIVQLREHGYSPEFAPGITEFVYKLIIFILIEDTGFYWVHRALHHKALYPSIHKIHHQYQDATIGIASEYAHPIEFLLSNLVPITLGPFLFPRVHYGMWVLWVAWRVAETCCSHSGYDLPFLPFHLLPFQSSASFHNFHHSRNVGNYSSFFTHWDWLMGTDKHYIRHLEKFGHVTDDRHQEAKSAQAKKI